MGLDGFSMGNLIPNSEMTVAQVAGEAEFLAAKEAKTEVKKMSESAEDGGVKRKKDDEENSKQKNSNKENSNENSETQDTSDSKGLTEEDFTNGDIKNFSLNLNENTDRVELINLKDKIVMETIDAKDLMNIMSKLNYASGIFINKKV